MEEQKDKRVLRVELDDEVKKVNITGLDGNEKVVMRQELDEDDLDLVVGGTGNRFTIMEDNSPIGAMDFSNGVDSGGARGSEIDPIQSHAYGNANIWH